MLALLVATAAGLLAIGSQANALESGDFREDLERLASSQGPPVRVFDEQTIGLDLRDDKFYFQDNLVNDMFKRNKFTHGLITLAGQSSDAVNTRTKESSYPFAVAQRTTRNSGTLSERWDVKDAGDGRVQFFALYHGDGRNDFVVNKVRAHLLRRLANALQDFVPVLDRASRSDAAGAEQLLVQDEVRQTIESIFAEVDQSIRLAMRDNDNSWASALVVMVTQWSVVTAAVGRGQVMAYDDSSAIHKLTLANQFDDSGAKNVFGAMRDRRITTLKPHVEFHSRDGSGFQMLALESAQVFDRMDDYDLWRIVRSEVNQHKGNAAHEQQIYSNSVSRILEASCKRVNVLERLFGKSPDHSVMLIGLERDYANIH